MTGSTSFPELSTALDAPLEMPSVAERRRRWLFSHPRWVWFALTMILTLAITLTVLYYVGALSTRQTPGMQYKHPSQPNNESWETPPNPKTPSTFHDDELSESESDTKSPVECFLDFETNSPRSSNSVRRNIGSRSAKMRFHLGLGLFESVDFNELRATSPFCVVASRAFAPDFQNLIPKIDIELMDGQQLTIYTHRGRFLQHLDAKRFYFAVKEDDNADEIFEDVWRLIEEFGPEFRHILVFVKANDNLSDALQELFSHRMRESLPNLRLINPQDIVRDLALASSETKDALEIPEQPFFGVVDGLIAKQLELIETCVDQAWHQFMAFCAVRYDLADQDHETAVLDHLKELAAQRDLQMLLKMYSQLRIIDNDMRAPISQLHYNLNKIEYSVLSFASEIGGRCAPPSLIPLSKPTSEWEVVRLLNDFNLARVREYCRLEGLKKLKATLESLSDSSNK